MPKLPKKPKAPGLIGGLGVTFKTMLKGAVTVQYPHEREDPPPRARGVIALKEENCTVCMLCARQSPDWCIYIEGHKEKLGEWMETVHEPEPLEVGAETGKK